MTIKFETLDPTDGLAMYNACINLAGKSDSKVEKYGCIVTGKAVREKNVQVFVVLEWGSSRADGTHAEMNALNPTPQNNIPYSISGIYFALDTLFVVGLHSDGTPIDYKSGYDCVYCAEKIVKAGIEKIALTMSDTPKSGIWSLRTANKALSESLEIAKRKK